MDAVKHTHLLLGGCCCTIGGRAARLALCLVKVSLCLCYKGNGLPDVGCAALLDDNGSQDPILDCMPEVKQH